ncbi:MAG: histidine phosphatase family protein [Actinomycetota bacterium]
MATDAPRRVLLLRHGQTAWNAMGRFQGQVDVDLDTVGSAQAARAAQQIAQLDPSRIVSSDLRRAQQTAAELAAHLDLKVSVDARLRETYAGAWQGMTAAEIAVKYGDERERWRRGEDVRPGGDGELRREVGARVASAVRAQVAGVPAGGLLVAVTHGGAISSGVPTLLGIPREYWPVVRGVNNCHWTVLEEYHGRWVMIEHDAFSLPTPVVGDES